MPFEAPVLVRGGGPPALAPPAARRLVRALARRLRVPHRSAAVVFAGDDLLRELNRRYRGKDRPTDVLSFPSGEEGHLGDVVISSPTARRQARRKGHPAAAEARVLILHGFLHLLGYDHETDDGQMDVLERSLRRELELTP
ncbi:MAG TPA: rRNA maturation RNase YbeY [Candidatus Polarisedimenticolia bacterium]|nr:rRNA maturation RNase YbeY [Candidatus Polarisedimenticolia bacterium]